MNSLLDINNILLKWKILLFTQLIDFSVYFSYKQRQYFPPIPMIYGIILLYIFTFIYDSYIIYIHYKLIMIMIIYKIYITVFISICNVYINLYKQHHKYSCPVVQKCPVHKHKVCGTDGKLYDSRCHLRYAYFFTIFYIRYR